MAELSLPSEIVLASNNLKKLAELQRVFEAENLKIKVYSLKDFPPYPEPAETELTFEGNALLKARAAVQNTGVCAVADDSGLEVDALNRMPGVFSARWAGKPSDDKNNLALLLSQISDVPDNQRSARFVCALALVTPEGTEKVWRETMEGQLTNSARGAGGFGYDPIFIPAGYEVTSAELSSAEKDAISHRGKAIRAMVADLIST
ncbi:MAG: non-canonical purine NTP pyrophosphatase, RdgB/HAM1 family [Propionibacterium sp.]|nr:MAG: non-canonical purine NTP pyrophosphatase, RdgB/HAM1 family [Propionibacterium sp.]